jgi:threonine synthase
MKKYYVGMVWRGLIDRYRPFMDISSEAEAITLHEGNTPLVAAPRLASWLGGDVEVFLKFEGMNPTGSFKDRGMTTAITQAKYDGAQSVICASTGNTSAAAAAYAARAGMKCFVLIPDGKIALGKLAASLAYGAQVIAISGSFDDGLRIVQEIAENSDIALVNSVNPARLEGQKTAAWEVCDQLGEAPDWLSLPVGNAGNISAYWLGFTWCREGKCPLSCLKKKKLPRLLGTQAAGAAPIVTGVRVDKPETKATAIRIGNPARWQQANEALAESNGRILAATDEQIFEAYHVVSRLEGIHCEPSSAASVAGLKIATQANPSDFIGKKIVCVLTGHGLKDPDSAIGDNPMITKVVAEREAVMRVLKP